MGDQLCGISSENSNWKRRSYHGFYIECPAGLVPELTDLIHTRLADGESALEILSAATGNDVKLPS